MSSPQGARLFDLGYRGYDGPRRTPVWAILTLAVFTARRVLGLRRGVRHKILPVLTLVIAFVPALVSVGVAALVDSLSAEDLITYGEYTFFIGSALVLFASLIAPEALCTDRRGAMLGLYLAGPLDRNRYLLAKGAAVLAVMLVITVGPLLFMLTAFAIAGYGPSAGETPTLLLRILASGLATALLYTAVSMAVSSFTTRRAVAAVAVVLLLLVPPIVTASAIESAGAPDALDLLGIPFVASELSYRIFDELPADEEALQSVSTWLVAAAVLAWTAVGGLTCWLRYRRIEAHR